MEKKIAVFPGSFDPFTKGHAHVVEKALEIFDEVIIFIADNPSKKRMFDKRIEFERIQKMYFKEMEQGRINVSIQEGTVVNIASLFNAKFIVKGVRSTADADYEIYQADVNKWLGGLQTVLIPCDKEYSHISSTLVRSLMSITGEFTEEAKKKIDKLMWRDSPAG